MACLAFATAPAVQHAWSDYFFRLSSSLDVVFIDQLIEWMRKIVTACYKNLLKKNREYSYIKNNSCTRGVGLNQAILNQNSLPSKLRCQSLSSCDTDQT
jgi:uncharacterized protein YllA (UPF0747 family)